MNNLTAEQQIAIQKLTNLTTITVSIWASVNQTEKVKIVTMEADSFKDFTLCGEEDKWETPVEVHVNFFNSGSEKNNYSFNLEKEIDKKEMKKYVQDIFDKNKTVIFNDKVYQATKGARRF